MIKSDLEAVPFDDPPTTAAGNGAHESFEIAKPVLRAAKPVITPAEAAAAIAHGSAEAATMGNSTRLQKSSGQIGRVLPHSLEAEEYLLSACLLDGQDVVSRCIDARITPESFYDSKHAIVFRQILTLYRSKTVIDVSIVAEELKISGQLDQVGGYTFLIQVSSRLPTTAQASYFVEKVREQAKLRAIIRELTSGVEDCYGFSGGIDEFTSDIRRRVDNVAAPSGSNGQRMDWDALLAFDPKIDPDCLMGNRFLGRTGACVIVAPSGVGKSVLSLQLAACAALGRPFFGMQMRVAMRVLYLQAEDDFGDVSESAQGFVRGYGITDDDRGQLRIRLRIERWNDVSGDRFLQRLRRAHDAWPFDLVIINPLFSFAGCNVSEQRELSPFLRNGLNSVLNETRAAAIVVHHTNKPPQDPGANDKAMDAELRYIGSGSAELTNWARAYITLQGVRAAGDRVHKMVFVKRGGRTGIVGEDGQSTNSVLIEHSKSGLCWMPSDYSPGPKPGGKFLARFDLSHALGLYDHTKAWAENELFISQSMKMDPRTVRRHRQAIQDNA